MTASYLEDVPVLLSFGVQMKGILSYVQSFGRILIDSGAYSMMTQGKKIDGNKYVEWREKFSDRSDAIAGIDSIDGDWRQSLKNYEKYGGFPTIHNTDPWELLPDLIPIARANRGWLGIGIKPPRQDKEDFVRRVCENTPDDIHIHGWALRLYRYMPRLDSVDSTNWIKDFFKVKNVLPWLTPAECVEIIVKRYKRESRVVVEDKNYELFEEVGG